MKEIDKLSKKEKRIIGWVGTLFSQFMMLLLATYIFIFENNEIHPAGWMVIGFLLCTMFIDYQSSRTKD